jgi:hypothetical protein
MKMTEIQQLIAALAQMGIGKPQKAKSGRKVKAKGRGRQKLTEAEKAVFMAKNDAACVETFTAAGYKDVQPRINVLTYDKFILQGRMVKKGEKSLRVGPFNLFHIDQTSPIVPAATAGATDVQGAQTTH